MQTAWSDLAGHCRSQSKQSVCSIQNTVVIFNHVGLAWAARSTLRPAADGPRPTTRISLARRNCATVQRIWIHQLSISSDGGPNASGTSRPTPFAEDLTLPALAAIVATNNTHVMKAHIAVYRAVSGDDVHRYGHFVSEVQRIGGVTQWNATQKFSLSDFVLLNRRRGEHPGFAYTLQAATSSFSLSGCTRRRILASFRSRASSRS